MVMRGWMMAAAVSVAAIAVPAAAQSVVVPGAYETTDAPLAQFAVFGNPSNSPFTFQYVISASELGGIATGTTINSIGFRIAGTPFLTPDAAVNFSQFNLAIGQSANPLTSLSTSFAANQGADTVSALSGPLSIAAGAFVDLPGEGPNPFYDLTFTTPYVYAGGALAITIRATPVSGSPAVAVDAVAPSTSSINTVGIAFTADATTGTVGILNAPVTRFGLEAAGVVPEPATWAMMIGGFGVVGGALRRRARREAIA
jgi:hypothetical protein